MAWGRTDRATLIDMAWLGRAAGDLHGMSAGPFRMAGNMGTRSRVCEMPVARESAPRLPVICGGVTRAGIADEGRGPAR
jgi:hypothetical protein